MPRYVVKFVKQMVSDQGQNFSSVQSSIEVDAANRNTAATSAQRLFCEQEHVGDWTLHADEVIVSEADFPS
jgi:hypothetical protein